MSDKIPIVININNKDVTLNVEPRHLLVDLLRNINNEVNVLANNVSMPTLQIITEFFVIFGMIILLFFVNISVTLITSFIFLFLATASKVKLSSERFSFNIYFKLLCWSK